MMVYAIFYPTRQTQFRKGNDPAHDLLVTLVRGFLKCWLALALKSLFWIYLYLYRDHFMHISIWLNFRLNTLASCLRS